MIVGNIVGRRGLETSCRAPAGSARGSGRLEVPRTTRTALRRPPSHLAVILRHEVPKDLGGGSAGAALLPLPDLSCGAPATKDLGGREISSSLLLQLLRPAGLRTALDAASLASLVLNDRRTPARGSSYDSRRSRASESLPMTWGHPLAGLTRRPRPGLTRWPPPPKPRGSRLRPAGARRRSPR
jgi:hypothetical protein